MERDILRDKRDIESYRKMSEGIGHYKEILRSMEDYRKMIEEQEKFHEMLKFIEKYRGKSNAKRLPAYPWIE